MSSFDFFDGEENQPDNTSEVAQQLERSLDFWAMGKEDYPPAIRGVMAEITDLREEVGKIVQKIGRDKDHPELVLKRLLWFEDKNGKLDEACEEAKAAFRPYPTNEEGLINWNDPNNPLLEKPSRHRLVVSDQFAATNYDQPDPDAMILDDDEDDDGDSGEIKPNSWKRKMTQTLKPWSIKQESGKIGYARPADDLLTALNVLFSRTKHGWLVVDMFKLKKRRGSMLTYARTFEYQRKGDQAFEFKMELFGAAAEYRARLGKTLKHVGCVFLEIGEDGETYVSKAVVDQPSEGDKLDGVKEVVLKLPARIVLENGKPSQIVLKKEGQYYESKIKPLVDQGKKLSTKIDLRKSNSDTKRFRFKIELELDGPLLVASSGDAVIFQLNDFLTRFAGTSLAKIRAMAKEA